jgi:hypothetical protein
MICARSISPRATYPVIHPLELDLVLESLLELLTTQDLLDPSLVTVLPGDLGVHHLLVLLGQGTSGLVKHFTIVTVLVTPLAVRERKERSARLAIRSGVL